MTNSESIRELSARLKREVLANSLEGVIVVFGVIGLIIGLKYVVLACALGRFVCGSAVSPSKFTFLFGCFVEVAYVTAAGCGIWLAAQSLGLATHLSAYVAWDSAFQISAAFLIAGLITNALAAPGLYDAQREHALPQAEQGLPIV